MIVIIQHPDGREYQVDEDVFREEYAPQGFAIAFYRVGSEFHSPETVEPPPPAPVLEPEY